MPTRLPFVLPALSAFILSAVCAQAVSAQTLTQGRLSVGAAAGLALPFHGDFDFEAAAWQVDGRFETSRYFAMGVFVEQWRHTRETVRTGVPLLGPSGLIGRIDRLMIRTRHTTRSVGWNLLARVPLGRTIITGGGGVGALLYERRSAESITGCQAPVPAACDSPERSDRFTNGAFSAHVQAGVDVAVTGWLAAMGQFRTIVPIEDPGAGHAAFTGGVRISF